MPCLATWSCLLPLLLAYIRFGSVLAASEVCDASGICQLPQDARYLFASFEYANGLSDQRYLWFQTALKLAKEQRRTLVLPKFWVPDADGDSYAKAHQGHFEPFDKLYDPAAFESYSGWISYDEFRGSTNATLKSVYVTPLTAKQHLGEKCKPGDVIKLSGKLQLFGDIWKVSKLRCLSFFEFPEPGSQRPRILSINTYSNTELPNYHVRPLLPHECRQRWPFEIHFNPSLVQTASDFIQTTLRTENYLAIHWRYGTSMHVGVDHLAGNVTEFLAKHDFHPEVIFLATNCQESAAIHQLEAALDLPIVQFQDSGIPAWQRALIDQIICSEAPYWLASNYQSIFSHVIAYHRAMTGKHVEEVKLMC